VTERSLVSYRDEFPVVREKSYLISASLGPVSERSKRYLQEYMEGWESIGAPEPFWFGRIFPRIGAVKRLYGEMIGADHEELAITTNVTMALASVLSCHDFGGARNRIVLTELDFPTNGHVALAHRRRGAEVEFLKSTDGLTVPVESFADAIDERTAVVIINRVLYRSSALQDAAAICRLAREAGAWSVIDDFHGAGIVPIDVHQVGCDFHTTGVLKWLCGGPGLTFLYARKDLLSSEIIAEVGPARIRERQGELTDYVMERADAAGLPVRSPRDRTLRGGVVNVGVGDQAEKIAEALFERDVCVDHRGDGIRVSPHFFNTEADIDRLFDTLGVLL
jgi:kynureninase